MDTIEVELSIVIPAYNERERIVGTLDAYSSFFDKSGIEYEIIVADFSNDGSKDVVRQYQGKHRRIRLLDIDGPGKGLAVYEGFRASKGRLLGFTDADNSVSPQEFDKILSSMGAYGAAIGSRGLKESKVTHYHNSFFRRYASILLGVLFVRLLFNLRIHDTQCGAKIFKRDRLVPILPLMRISNSIFDVELLWRFSKVGRINEIPIVWIDSKYSHFKWTQTIGEGISLLRVRLGL
jgi:glycosyltransferase involved in cell wall biosynthesis